jgi:hypothetical protein
MAQESARDKEKDFLLEEPTLSYPEIFLDNTKELSANYNREEFKSNRFCRFFRLEELLYDGEKPTREAWQNFISAIRVAGMNFIYVIRGDVKGTQIYFGLSAKPGTLEAAQLGDYAHDIIESSFQGMFRGSKLKALREDETEAEIFKPIRENNYVNIVTGVPALQEERKTNQRNDYQGMDRLISAMHGESWQMVIVCEPLSKNDVAELREQAYEIFDKLSLLAKSSLQSSRSESHGENLGTSTSQSHTIGESTSQGKTETAGTSSGQSYSENVSVSHTTTDGETVTVSHTSGKNFGHSDSRSNNESYQRGTGRSSGQSKSKSASKSSSHSYSGDSDTHGTSDSSTNQTGESSNESTTRGTGQSHTDTSGTSESETQGKSRNKSSSEVQGKSRANQTSSGTTKSESFSDTRGTNQSDSVSTGKTSGTSETEGSSLTASVDVVNKKAAEFLKYLDETLLPRLSAGNNRGMFKTAVYLLTETKSINARLCNNVTAIFQGKSSAFTPLTPSETFSGGEWLSDFQIHGVEMKRALPYGVIYGVPCRESRRDLATFLTSDEVGIMAGLPLSEVPGIALRRYVPFGLNPNLTQQENGTEMLPLGNLVYGGRILRDNPVSLDKNVLNKHMFVTGITGSGKTVTCKRLLKSSRLPFLVIEPAKTEYQELICQEGMEDVIVFTLGTESGLPLRFNPFELLPDENLTAHIDLLKAAFMSSFQFEASMPQIFEMATYRVYEQCGRNTDTGEFEGEEVNWPTLTLFIKKLEEVVKEQKFGAELEGNYRGSLISRIANLTYGAKGRMLNCERSIDFQKLLESKVVIEMEDLKSPQDKALIMALIMSRLNEAVKRAWRADKNFRHITLIEEAHRLLSKVMPGDDEGKKYSVSMFTDMLAEIRKYGESLIIVDQIPNKLAEDVLKNTATKIVHKLVAKDDKETIGDTMMLEDEQKKFLSNLLTGRAIVFTENWHKPICVQVEEIPSPTNEDLSLRLAEMRKRVKKQNRQIYHPEEQKLIKNLRHLLGKWLMLNETERREVFDRLPQNFCKNEKEALDLLKLIQTSGRKRFDLGAEEKTVAEAIYFAASKKDYEAFSQKYHELLRFFFGRF